MFHFNEMELSSFVFTNSPIPQIRESVGLVSKRSLLLLFGASGP
jgi:hypothetical protein